jgi:hypothetical protein
MTAPDVSIQIPADSVLSGRFALPGSSAGWLNLAGSAGLSYRKPPVWKGFREMLGSSC